MNREKQRVGQGELATDASQTLERSETLRVETSETLDAIARTLEEATRTCAAILDEAGGSRIATRFKTPTDLVTEYDTRSETNARDVILRSFPSDVIIGEEASATSLATAPADARSWYIDPLDGTANFAHGVPFYAVSIGVYRGPEYLAGRIVAPALGRAWSCVRGRGAFRELRDPSTNETRRERIRVSDATELGASLLGTGFSGKMIGRPGDNIDEFRDLTAKCHGVRRIGAATVELAFVADGTYEGFWDSNLGPWDLAAGCALILEAGGRVCRRDRSPVVLEKGEVVATNAGIHEALVAKLGEHRA